MHGSGRARRGNSLRATRQLLRSCACRGASVLAQQAESSLALSLFPPCAVSGYRVPIGFRLLGEWLERHLRRPGPPEEVAWWRAPAADFRDRTFLSSVNHLTHFYRLLVYPL